MYLKLFLYLSFNSLIFSFINNYKINKSLKLYSDYKNIKTFLDEQKWKNPEMEDVFTIINNIQQACGDINKIMRKISTYHHNEKTINSITNKILKAAISASNKVNLVISKDETTRCYLSDNMAFNGNYVVVYNSLDRSDNIGSDNIRSDNIGSDNIGSNNINLGLPSGTIFGIYKKNQFQKFNSNSEIKRGNELIVAGYCLYSASTNLILTYGLGVHMFIFDDIYNKFILINNNITIPQYGSIYSFNHPEHKQWTLKVQNYYSSLHNHKNIARYSGSLVYDTHNILFNGGICGYPATFYNTNGKIHLVYEANPIAKLIIDAGGKAINGTHNILNLKINDIHQQTPFIFGSSEQILDFQNY